jgi:hypothetical protein
MRLVIMSGSKQHLITEAHLRVMLLLFFLMLKKTLMELKYSFLNSNLKRKKKEYTRRSSAQLALMFSLPVPAYFKL